MGSSDGPRERKQAEASKPVESRVCPMSGKTGKCPISGMLSLDPEPAASSDTTADSSGKKPNKDPFAAGSKPIIVEGSSSSVSTRGRGGSSKLWDAATLLCPVHWGVSGLQLYGFVWLVGLLM